MWENFFHWIDWLIFRWPSFFITFNVHCALHAKIKTKNIEESANYQLRCCTSEFSLWERRGKWRGKCEIRNYRFNPAQCVVFPPMCKYHVISRVWLNLDVSLSAFKSTILRYWVLNFVKREISRKGIRWNIKFDFCDFELLFYRLKRLIWDGWFRMIERFFSKETKSPRKIRRNRKIVDFYLFLVWQTTKI